MMEATPIALDDALRRFGRRVRDQLPDLLRAYQITTRSGRPGYVDQPGAGRRIRPWCDAVEIAAMFGLTPGAMTREEWIAALRAFQHPETGLVPEVLPEEQEPAAQPAAEPRYEERYNTMIVNYALECLGSHLAHPVANAESLDAGLLVETLASLHWRDAAWGAGHWVDCYASCLYPNLKYFGLGRRVEALFAWLDAHCDRETGIWGERTAEERWLQPVNGFYRLTRGTYAQFGRPLPHPERSLDTILTHCSDEGFFGAGKGNACNVLDVVHPMWLCAKQTRRRQAEAAEWIRARLPIVLTRWVDGKGMAFDPKADGPNGQPGLQGTEMWLSIIYLMAEQIGLSGYLGYAPRGVHRLEAALRV